MCERKKGRDPHLHEQTFWSLAGQDSSACAARPCSFSGWRPRQKKRRPRRKRCSSLCETRYLGWQRDAKNSRERECVTARKECIAMKLTRQGKRTSRRRELLKRGRNLFATDRNGIDLYAGILSIGVNRSGVVVDFEEFCSWGWCPSEGKFTLLLRRIYIYKESFSLSCFDRVFY